MKNKKYNLLKALSWYTIGIMLIKSVNFFSLRLFTGILSTTDYGLFGVYQSYLNIFELLIMFGTCSVIRMVRYDKNVDYECFISSIIYIPIIGTITFVILVKIIFCFISDFAGISPGVWYAVFASAGCRAISNIITSKLILEGEYKKYIAYSLINTLLNIGTSVVSYYTLFRTKDAYWSRILGDLLANFFAGIFLMTCIRLEKPNISYIRKGIALGAPLLIQTIAGQILVQTDKIIIGRISSYSEVGIYSAAESIAAIPGCILTAVENSWIPWYFAKLFQKEYNVIKEKNTEIIFLYTIGVALFILGSPEIVRLMTDYCYWNSIYVLIPLSITTYAEFLYIIPLNAELYYKFSQKMWVYTITAAMINIIFDIFLIYKWGYLAGAYVTCMARILLFVMHYRRVKRIDKHDILSIKFAIISLIVLFVINGITVILIDRFVIRWIFIVLIIIVVIICNMRRKERSSGPFNYL